jgi:uncharacterized protein (DUF952 family)
VIYHLLESDAWEAADDVVARPGADGIVHCCDEQQLAGVRARFVPPTSAVVALALDPTQLPVETRYEAGSDGEPERFPHVYGAVRRSDVVGVLRVR